MKFGRPLAAVLTVAALSGALTGTAMAAPSPSMGEYITISAGDGTLQGEYTLYQIGSYSDAATADSDKVSSVNVTGDSTQNAWAKNAIEAWNKDSDHDITVDAGLDAAGAIARINENDYTGADKATASDQLSGVAQRLASANGKPSATKTVTAADATGKQSVTVGVPAGLYLIVDTAGSPLIVGTKIGGKDMTNMTLGTAVVKEDTTVTKQLSVDGKQYSDAVSASYGQTVKVKATQVIPNGTHPGGTNVWKLTDAPQGMAYTDGTLKLTVDGTGVDSGKYTLATTGVVKGDPTIRDDAGNPADPDITVPSGGFVLDVSKLVSDPSLAGKTLTIEYEATVTKNGQANGTTSDNKLTSHTVRGVNGGKGTPKDTPSPTPKVTYGGFTLKKTSLSDKSLSLSGAGFKIQNSKGEWLTYDSAANTWGVAHDEAGATMFLTGDSNHDGKVDAADGTSGTGSLTVEGLAAGTYTVKEAQAPTGYRNESFSLPTFTATIGTDGNATFTGKDLPNLTADNKDGTVTVSDIQSLAQLPATGGAWTVGAYLAGAMLVAALAAGVAVRGVKRNREADAE